MTDSATYDALVELNAFPEVAPPPLRGTFWVLGKSYNLPQHKNEYLRDVKSRIWCTYRKGFRAISGTSLTSDSGWGCTLRCGQMLMAQALICQHLGRGWRWPVGCHDPSYSTYMEILHKFLDIRDSEYSLQMIALQGADFGRPVGHWFGPNNVAQALKKLSIHDELSQMAVHVAMDMLVVIEDLKRLCREPHEIPGHIKVTNEQGEPISSLRWRRSVSDVSEVQGQMSSERAAVFQDQDAPSQPIFKTPPKAKGMRKQASLGMKTQPSTALSDKHGTGQAVGRLATVTRNSSIKKALTTYITEADRGVSFTESLDFLKLSITSNSTSVASSADSQSEFETLKEPTKVHCDDPPTSREEELTAGAGASEDGLGPLSNFRPLLLFIPLRLGQDSFNMEYAVALKSCLEIPQSVGFIGGRPRHALYFIGYHEDQLLYLDPHTVQPTINITDQHIPDQSYHCALPDRIPISDLDPSIALGFFCKNEEELDDLIRRLKSEVLSHGSRYKMFEMTEERPSYWGPFDSHTDIFSPGEPFMLVDRPIEEVDDELDEGFEIISWPTTPVTHITRSNK